MWWLLFSLSKYLQYKIQIQTRHSSQWSLKFLTGVRISSLERESRYRRFNTNTVDTETKIQESLQVFLCWSTKYTSTQSSTHSAWNIRIDIVMEARSCSALFFLCICFIVNIKVWLILIYIGNVLWLTNSFILLIQKESDLCLFVFRN